MKVYGNLDMQGNIIAGLTLEAELEFPVEPKEGRLVFYNQVLYLSVYIANQIAWIPLTNELQTLVYTNEFASTTWTIVHNYNTYELLTQVYNESNHVIIPDSLQMVDMNTVVVTFLNPVAGKAVIISKKNI